MYNKFFKRLFDIILSLISIIILFPLFCIAYFSVKISDSHTAIFVQKRVGKGGKIFNIYKFRTMKTDCPKDIPTHLLVGADTYITRIGKILRKYSIDELPQIYNILKGDMSIIGPRPAILSQKDLLDERKKNGAYNLRPGLTGYAQIKGRDKLTITEKAKYDGEYATKMGFVFDVKIFFTTILKIIKKEDVVEGSEKKEFVTK